MVSLTPHCPHWPICLPPPSRRVADHLTPTSDVPQHQEPKTSKTLCVQYVCSRLAMKQLGILTNVVAMRCSTQLCASRLRDMQTIHVVPVPYDLCFRLRLGDKLRERSASAQSAGLEKSYCLFNLHRTLHPLAGGSLSHKGVRGTRVPGLPDSALRRPMLPLIAVDLYLEVPLGQARPLCCWCGAESLRSLLAHPLGCSAGNSTQK